MKFIAFNVREDEKPFFKKWVEENNIEISLRSDVITEDNLNEIKGYDAIIGLQTTPYPNKLFDKMQEYGIKGLSIRNVGFDNIDVRYANSKGVIVTNVPAYSPNAIAEFAVTQMMSMLRRKNEFNKKIAHNDFRWEPTISKELRMQTVGVIGTGRIGKTVIKILEGFGAKVVAYDPNHTPEFDAEGIYVDSLDELYKKSDIITLHIPAVSGNGYFFGDLEFSKMKDGVYIVNTARGALIDSKALLKALKSGKVAGAALDTYENENPIFNHNLQGQEIKDDIFNELMSFDNVYITPHIAFYTETAVENMVTISLDSAKDIVQKGTAITEVKLKK